MKIAKWGNNLAIRIPAEVARKLKLKSGDEVQISVTGEGSIEVSRVLNRTETIEKIRKLRIRSAES